MNGISGTRAKVRYDMQPVEICVVGVKDDVQSELAVKQLVLLLTSVPRANLLELHLTHISFLGTVGAEMRNEVRWSHCLLTCYISPEVADVLVCPPGRIVCDSPLCQRVEDASGEELSLASAHNCRQHHPYDILSSSTPGGQSDCSGTQPENCRAAGFRWADHCAFSSRKYSSSLTQPRRPTVAKPCNTAGIA